MTGALMVAALANAGDLYHVKNQNAMSCNEKKITAEINYEVKHPGSLSEKTFMDIAAEGKCSPWSPQVVFEVLRFETFSIPTGVQKVAYGVLAIDGSPPSYFYVMQSDIEKIPNQPKKIAATPATSVDGVIISNSPAPTASDRAAEYVVRPDHRSAPICKNKDVFIRVTDLREHFQEDRWGELVALEDKGRCVAGLMGINRYRIIQTESIESSSNVYEIATIEAVDGAGSKYILRKDLIPYTGQDGIRVATGCTTSTGGEVDRLEAGPTGQLYHKKYMITTKCINGVMKSLTKRLN